ncbi:MAG: TIGR03085 family protein [Hamadaea sp.]|nr:TIGR03085 family protein [Hamadaea sp.]
MSRYARRERLALAALLSEIGPDAPTLCDGWATRDLAAHLVTRERRPDAALGIVLKPVAAHTRAVQERFATRDFADLVAELREPPIWSPVSNPLLDELVNVTEMFIHHEDARRAQPDWSPRVLGSAHQAALWARVRRTARLALRRFPSTVVLDAGEFGAVTAGAGGPRVTVTGDPGELSLFVSGRQAYARVELDGDAGSAEQLSRARLGI